MVLGLTARMVLGPFSVSVEELGLRLAATIADGSGGTLEPLDLGLAFKPPTGVGLELDLGVGGGAGFLWLEPEIGRYSGALALDLVEIGLARDRRRRHAAARRPGRVGALPARSPRPSRASRSASGSSSRASAGSCA